MPRRFTLYILAGMVLGLLARRALPCEHPRSEGAGGRRRIFLAPDRHFPASDQDDHRAPGADHPDRRHRQDGRRLRRRAGRAEDARVVFGRHHRLAPDRHADGGRSASRLRPAPLGRRPRGRFGVGGGPDPEGLLGPRLPDLGDRRHGQERDPADRRLLDLRRSGPRLPRRARPWAPDRHRAGGRR